jgi:hypothetical protein
MYRANITNPWDMSQGPVLRVRGINTFDQIRTVKEKERML